MSVKWIPAFAHFSKHRLPCFQGSLPCFAWLRYPEPMRVRAMTSLCTVVEDVSPPPLHTQARLTPGFSMFTLWVPCEVGTARTNKFLSLSSSKVGAECAGEVPGGSVCGCACGFVLVSLR